jgi:rfaE bifunctional protein kinase chain/domain
MKVRDEKRSTGVRSAGWEDGGRERRLGPELPLLLRDRAPRVTVVGDPILDGWWRGRTERMSREAPAPVVEVFERRHVPGGAANTAVNLAALGAQVSLVGVAGDDEAGHMLRGLLVAAGVDVSGLLLAPEVRTTTKVRIVGGEQILLRIDEGTDVVAPEEVRDRAVLASAAVLRRSDAVVVCD